MEEEYIHLIEEIRDAYFLIQQGRIIIISNRMAECFGYSKDELINISAIKLIVANERERIKEFYNKRLTIGQGPQQYETVIMAKNGISIPIEVKVWLAQYQGQSAIAGILTSITECKEYSEVSQGDGWQYGTMIENMPQMIFLRDNNSIYISCNKNYAKHLGIEPEEILGKTVYEFFSSKIAENLCATDNRVIKSGQTESIEERYIQGEDERIVRLTKAPIRDIEGNIIGVLGIIHDVIEQKKASEEMQGLLKKLPVMLEFAPYGITIMDANTIITQVNEQTLKLYGGISKDELIGKSGVEVVSPQDRQKAMQYFRRCLDEGLVIKVEYTITRPNDSRVSMETSTVRLKDANGDAVGLISITRDITDEKRLRENEQFFITETIKVQEGERRRLAQTLHDDTIQELLLATHRMQDMIEGTYGRLTKRAQEHLEEIRALIERVVVEMRRFTMDLRPNILDELGLASALTWLTKRLKNEDGMKVKLNVFGKKRRLSSEIELNLFRIAQEALNNVRKHAGASATIVTLEFGEKEIKMSVRDNGRGFELPDMIGYFARQQKLGLIGIVERVRLLDGRHNFESTPGKGTTVTVEIRG